MMCLCACQHMEPNQGCCTTCLKCAQPRLHVQLEPPCTIPALCVCMQANLIVQLICDHMLPSGSQCVEVSQAAQQAFNKGLQERLQRSVWLSGCSSWYLDSPKQAESASEAAVIAGNDSAAAHDKVHALPDSDKHSSSNNSSSSGRMGGNSGGFALWPGLCAEFWWRTRRLKAEDWVFGKSQDSSPAAMPSAAAHNVKPDAAWSADDLAADGVAVVSAIANRG